MAQLRIRRLLGVLGPRILELAEGHANEELATAVDDAIVQGRHQAALLEGLGARVREELAREGIRTSGLKGPALSRAIHGDAGRRLSSDIDLLVAADQMHAAVGVVRGLGYEAPRDHVGADALPLLHFAMAHERGALPTVELHWRIHWYEHDFAHERLLAPAAAPCDWRPSPADELAALLLYYARDGFLDLRLAADIGAWWDTCGGELEEDALRACVARYPALAGPLTTAAVVAEQIVGVPLSVHLTWAGAAGARGRLAARLADPHPRCGRAQLHAQMGLIDALLMPRREGRAFLARQVMPPREVLAELDRRAPKRRQRTRLPRAIGVLGRYTLALSRLLRRAERLPPITPGPTGGAGPARDLTGPRLFLPTGAEVSALPDVCGAQATTPTRGSFE